jgi:hypothetical protein
MPYQEWIRRGLDPLYPIDYWELSRLQARAHMKRVLGAIPERIEQLKGFVREQRPGWEPDYSEGAFRVLGEVFDQSIDTIPRAPAEVERERRERPEIFNVLEEPVRNYEFTDRTYSLIYDCAIYFALDLMSKEPRLKWQLDESKTGLTRNQPVLKAPRIGRGPDRLECQPFELFKDGALSVADKDENARSWVDIYRYWMREAIPWYQSAMPSDRDKPK